MIELKSPYDVLRTVLKTEKTTMIGTQNKYVFLVNPKANKIQIKKAIEDVYKVKVEKVNTMSREGKMKRLRMHQPGRTAATKKAVVTLREGQKIDIA